MPNHTVDNSANKYHHEDDEPPSSSLSQIIHKFLQNAQNAMPFSKIKRYIHHNKTIETSRNKSDDSNSIHKEHASRISHDNNAQYDQKVILNNIDKFYDVTAGEIKIPYVDIIIFNQDLTINDVSDDIITSGYTRYPVYKDGQDHIVGLIHIKDIIRAFKNQKTNQKLSAIKRPVLFISPTMFLLDLLAKMRLERTHAAIVVDEYGGVDGMVTIEDVIEEIIGDFRENAVTHAPDSHIQECKNGDYIVDGRFEIKLLEDKIGKFLSQEDLEHEQETIAGMISANLGRVPASGEAITHDSGIIFEIIDANPRRIKCLRIKKNVA